VFKILLTISLLRLEKGSFKILSLKMWHLSSRNIHWLLIGWKFRKPNRVMRKLNS